MPPFKRRRNLQRPLLHVVRQIHRPGPLLQVQALTDQLTTARSQLALKVSLVAEKDALIAALLQQTGQVPARHPFWPSHPCSTVV